MYAVSNSTIAVLLDLSSASNVTVILDAATGWPLTSAVNALSTVAAPVAEGRDLLNTTFALLELN
ncbi:hypothetical protein [Metabacillus fastidiosus]|uniref:hypothetical protein n=1 Tax=Metabacillus fastidiosus TaxID=1458 RepID=UPI003D29AF75